VFLRLPRARSEAAAIVSLCIALDALPGYPKRGATMRPLLDIADRLCEALEAFRSCIPHSTVEFEDLLLIASELAAGDLLEISNCRSCRCAILSLKQELPRYFCVHCESRDSASRGTLATSSGGG
jgi:hypothetical protein